jgi:hypothetical protein
MTNKCLFDVVFGDGLEFSDLKAFRMQIAEKIYQENTTIGDDWRWQYVRDCIKGDFTNQPMALQVLVILCACWQHPCIRRIILTQYGDKEFLEKYFEYLDYFMNDFCQSDPVYSDAAWKWTFETLRRGWQDRDLQRPWDTLSIRDTGPNDSLKRQTKRKQTE